MMIFVTAIKRIVRSSAQVVLPALVIAGCCSFIQAQTENSPFPSLQTSDVQARPPMTNQEFVRLLYQLPAHPEQRDKLVDEIRKRGINFPLTDGLRSLVATKSGNDALLRRTLEEAERKRLNP